jgi:hypothetical protein
MKRKLFITGVLAVFVVALVTIVFLTFIGHAKRGKRPVVTPVVIAGIEYRAPNATDNQGVVEAWDVSTKKLLWQKKVYYTPKVPFAEQDTQWNFITTMTVGASTNELVITNERGGQYILDCVSKKAKRVKGSILTGW